MSTTPIAPAPKPLPAFYCVYLLRSIKSHSSLYIGSTPNPVRRLRQHNGISKGGAARTSRDTLRPWEMSLLVVGFPSHIGALQFEWAYQNPHLTLHIPSSSRLVLPTQKKKSGRPKRPRHTLTSVIQNLHLLLHVPSFSRWPLQLRFFSEDVWKKWCKYTEVGGGKEVRGDLDVICDFQRSGDRPSTTNPNTVLDESQEDRLVKSAATGIDALEVTHAPLKQQLLKSKNVFDFELEGNCSICKEKLEPDSGLYTICTRDNCTATTHMTCLSEKWLKAEGPIAETELIPTKGKCHSCGTESKWIDIVKEVTLRARGQKEIEKLIKEKRVKKVKESKAKDKGKTKAKATVNGIAATIAASKLAQFSDEDEEADESDDELSDLDAMFADEDDEEDSDVPQETPDHGMTFKVPKIETESVGVSSTVKKQKGIQGVIEILDSEDEELETWE